jgi:hypothetical protein
MEVVLSRLSTMDTSYMLAATNLLVAYRKRDIPLPNPNAGHFAQRE